jgi:hypothetical protein
MEGRALSLASPMCNDDEGRGSTTAVEAVVKGAQSRCGLGCVKGAGGGLRG